MGKANNDWLQRQGGVDTPEMLRTFNCGIGMTLCVRPDDVDASVALLADHGVDCHDIGEVVPHAGPPEVVLAADAGR